MKRRDDEGPAMSIWGAEARPSESQTRFLGSIGHNPDSVAQLPLEMGEYTITSMLGKGGMGVVFEGEHRRMQRRVAVKVLRSASAHSSAAHEQFLAEIRAVARLLHPRIVTAFDAGQYGSVVYLVMEYVDGMPLNEWVARSGPLNLEQAISMVRQTAEGLAHAHHNNVIHRDVKPNNIMVTTNGDVKLLDLGLASLTQEAMQDDRSSRPQTICGTPEFMAPEQFDNTHLTAAVDIYALGCTLFYLLVGQTPYQGSFFELMRAHCYEPFPQLHQFGIAHADQLQPLIDGMVAKSPTQRLASMDEVIACLDLLVPTSRGSAGSSASESGSSSIVDSIRAAMTQPDDLDWAGSLVPTGEMNHSTGSGLAETAMVSRQTICGIDCTGQTLSAALVNESHWEPQSLELDGKDRATLRLAVATSRSRGAVFGDQAFARLGAGDRGCENALLALRQAQPIRFGQSHVPPAMPLTLIFNHVQRIANQFNNRSKNTLSAGHSSASSQGLPTHAIITVESSLGQNDRLRLCESALLGGFSMVRLLDRNLAAALSQFSLEPIPNAASAETGELPDGFKFRLARPAGSWLSISITELSMEVALISVDEDRIQVRAVASKTDSGTPRWSRRLRRYLRKKTEGSSSSRSSDSSAGNGDLSQRKAITQAIDTAIEALPRNDNPRLDFNLGMQRVRGTLSTSMILASCSDLVQMFGEVLGQTLAEAGMDGDEITHCIASGPLTQCQPILGILRSFGIVGSPELVDTNAVAANVAAWLNQAPLRGQRHPSLVACNPRSVGVRCEDGSSDAPISLVIPRLTALPARVQHPLGTNQASKATLFESGCDAETQWEPIEELEFDSVMDDGLAYAPSKNASLKNNRASRGTSQANIEVDEQGRVRCQILGMKTQRRSSRSMPEDQRTVIRRRVEEVAALWQNHALRSQVIQTNQELIAEGSSF